MRRLVSVSVVSALSVPVFGTAGSVLAQNVSDGGSAGAISLIALPLNDAIDIRLDGRIDEAAWS